jgi:hypothetical protein
VERLRISTWNLRGSVWRRDSSHLIEPDLPLCCTLHVLLQHVLAVTLFTLLVTERLNQIYTPAAPGATCVVPLFFINISLSTGWNRQLNWKPFCSIWLKSSRGLALLWTWREDEDIVYDIRMFNIALIYTRPYTCQGCTNYGRLNFVLCRLTSKDP